MHVWTIVLTVMALIIGLLAWLLTGDDGRKAEEEFFEAQKGTPVATMRIAYLDHSGVDTTRDVAVFKVYPRLGKFEAFCRLRQDRRTFLFDGVTNAIDLSTGEIISDVRSFLKTRARDS